jgi:sugar lactone lactonase YvrE
MKNRKILILALTLIVAGCSNNAPVNIQPVKGQLENSDLNFSTEALTRSYLSRKLNSYFNPSDENKVLKELEYGRFKHPCLLRQAISSNPGMLTNIEALTAVSNKRFLSPGFDSFMNFLEEPGGNVTTVAGIGGFNSYSGEPGPATSAELNYPYDVAFDRNGDLFITDTYNSVVRKVDNNGIITVIAGIGISGYGGDGEQATLATLSRTGGLAFDHSGNLYIGDYNNHRIRKVDLNGIITTFAGGGEDQSDGIQATDAFLNGPWAIAFDQAGNTYINEVEGRKIRKVDINGVITTFAGGGADRGDGIQATDAYLSQPWDITFDSSGNLYIADVGNDNSNKIRKVDTNGVITTFAGTGNRGYSGDGGPATEAEFDNSWNIIFDQAGNLYVGASSDNKIRKIDTNGIITTFAGIGGEEAYNGENLPATSSALAYPSGMAFDNFGNMYFADNDNFRIRKIGC